MGGGSILGGWEVEWEEEHPGRVGGRKEVEGERRERGGGEKEWERHRMLDIVCSHT